MNNDYIAPEVEFVTFSEEECIVNASPCSPYCEVVCTDECQEEKCFSLCPNFCYVVF